MAHRIVVIDEAQKFLLAAENLATDSQELGVTLQLLQSKKDKADSILKQRLFESSQFELSHFLTRFRQSGYREIHKEELAQVRQNLTELQDSDLRE